MPLLKVSHLSRNRHGVLPEIQDHHRQQAHADLEDGEALTKDHRGLLGRQSARAPFLLGRRRSWTTTLVCGGLVDGDLQCGYEHALPRSARSPAAFAAASVMY